MTARQTAPVHRMLVTSILALTLAVSASSSAMASPVSDKQAQAAAVEAQIEALNIKAEIATEKYDDARSRNESLSRKVRTSTAKITKLKSRTKVLQKHLDTRANQMYRNGPVAFISVLLNVESFEELDSTIRVLTDLNQSDASTVAELKQNKADEQATNAALIAAKADAAKQQSAMASNAKVVKEQLASREAVLNGLSADIRTLIAQKQAADEAAARARYLALVKRQQAAAAAKRKNPPKPKSVAKKSTNADDSGGDAPPSTKGEAAVAAAMRAIGKPYQWAGSGPNSFDCSGLTMWAYKQVGVSLPHSSRAQISRGSRISRANLQPGDLVFFGSPIHHVGMYVGDGDYIHSPYSGARVRVARLSSHSGYAGACRPR